MKAIDIAWEDNLKEEKDDQYKNKQELIEDRCPNGFDINLKEPKYCKEDYDEELCTKCWNRQIKDNEKEISTLIDNKLTFKDLRICPTNTDIVINERCEDTFSKAVKDNDIIVYIENDTDIYYDDIPDIIKWLQEVYDYSTELKSKIQYVDFNTAKEHMDKGNKTKLKDCTYYIKDGELYFNLYSEPKITSLSLPMLDSNKWILL